MHDNWQLLAQFCALDVIEQNLILWSKNIIFLLYWYLYPINIILNVYNVFLSYCHSKGFGEMYYEYPIFRIWGTKKQLDLIWSVMVTKALSLTELLKSNMCVYSRRGHGGREHTNDNAWQNIKVESLLNQLDVTSLVNKGRINIKYQLHFIKYYQHMYIWERYHLALNWLYIKQYIIHYT